MGHGSVGITLNLYSHPMPGMQEEAAPRLDALLGEESAVKVAR